MLWVFLSFVWEFFRRDKGHAVLRVMTTFLGVMLCGFFLGHLLLLRDMRLLAGEGFRFIGRELVFFLVAVIWTTDVGAWVVGKSIGRVKLAPIISPKKTLEGTAGGTLLGVLVGWIYRQMFLQNAMGPREAMFYALVISVVAQFSDLTESLIKRSFGVKNSSELLPGHGGVLDRFDSFIFATPFFYYMLLASGRFQ
jgi:phosphatidate cytidylyltransferase